MDRGLKVVSRSPEETRLLGAALAPVLLPGDVVALSGELGSGKTVFVQGLAAALGVTGRVTSPTFTLVHEYQGRYPIVHLDVYRLDSIQEVFDLGFEELLDPGAVLLIEWGEAVSALLPARHLDVVIERGAADDERVLTFAPHGGDWARKLEGMRSTAEELFEVTSGPDGARFLDV
jgi:tRNA threonylcarbamoyladenosine biosynthesis protein TsaE